MIVQTNILPIERQAGEAPLCPNPNDRSARDRNELILAFVPPMKCWERSSAVVCQRKSPSEKLRDGVEATFLREIFLARAR